MIISLRALWKAFNHLLLQPFTVDSRLKLSFQMSISAVKLNENVDQCDTSSSKVTSKEITGVMPLALPALSKTFGWTEVGFVSQAAN